MLPDTTHELDIPAEPARVAKHRMISDNDKRKTNPHMISIMSTLIHPGRVSPASASPLTSLISRVRKTSDSVANSAENRLSKRKPTRVPQSVGGKVESSESVLRSGGERWCWNKSRSSGCCEHDSNIRTNGALVCVGQRRLARQPARRSGD